MGIKIKKEPFSKAEKTYRLITAVTFYEILGVLLSAAVTVPLFASETAYWMMILYPAMFFIFCLNLAGCAALAFVTAKKTSNEVFIVQGVLHTISFVLTVLNCKLFTAIFLYGIKQDAAAEKLTGTDTDAFVEAAFSNAGNLLVALIITAVLAVLSTVKLVKERHNG